MIQRLFLFVVASAGGYVLTVAGAFVFWSWTGASGPSYTPLLVVLFAIAPAAGLACGVYAASRPLRRRVSGQNSRTSARSDGARSWPASPDLPPAWRSAGAPERPDPKGNRGWRLGVAIGGALLVGAFLVANKLANDRVPTVPHIPRISR
ncbi:MAG: hypothetical protein ACK4MV_10400 [Beijerinckiaceae bacterium]